MVAVLDWELSTLGHPLADIAHLCMIYLPLPIELTANNVPGTPDETTLTGWYAAVAKVPHPIPDWSYFRALACFRMAAIAQVSCDLCLRKMSSFLRVCTLEVFMETPAAI